MGVDIEMQENVISNNTKRPPNVVLRIFKDRKLLAILLKLRKYCYEINVSNSDMHVYIGSWQ